MDLLEIAKRLRIHPSVIDNYYEEWQFEQKEDDEDYYQVSFLDFLCNEFAECAFLTEAAENGSDAMACLEAYDDAYQTVEAILNE